MFDSFNRCMLFICCMIAVLEANAVESPDFERDVALVIAKRCLECHQGNQPSGGLNLSSAAGLAHGGDSGPVLDESDPAFSELLLRVTAGEMPPEEKGQPRKLPADEIDVLRAWVHDGAKWPVGRELDLFETSTDVRAGRDWWSLQPILRPPVPIVNQDVQPSNPIDAFILAKYQDHNLTPAKQADETTLVRRLAYDLLGLPPHSQVVDDYLHSGKPNAWEILVDRMLSQPEYGERWGRYWLDLARYADTCGYERDQEIPFAWKYRDWVVQSLNRDMPYRDFVRWQIAGDEISERTEASVIATGFLRLGTWNDEPNDPEDYQYDRLEDLVHTTASSFLAMTVKCARCHVHKFDPISQVDYYRMASAFWPGPIAARDRELLGGPTKDELGLEEVLGWTDVSANPKPLFVLKNGERDKPLFAVEPASLSMISQLFRTFDVPSQSDRTSMRRTQLAEWIIAPEHPLTARVIVNRVWQHHFGQGLVRTPNNFGFHADPPTHPELLDWLAAEFRDSGGSIKHMHRLILTSQTWKQASVHVNADAYSQIDPTNRLLWRFSLRRLDAESLRDSMLAVTGSLDRRMGGESFRPELSPEVLEGLSQKSAAWQASRENEQWRRSIYMFIKRGLMPPMMVAFDMCDATQTCGARDVTTVPTQSLALLNNPFVHHCSQQLAERIAAESNLQEAQIEQIWMRIFGRSPTKLELETAKRHLELQNAEMSQTVNDEKESSIEVLVLASLCHVLLNSNEFLYVD